MYMFEKPEEHPTSDITLTNIKKLSSGDIKLTLSIFADTQMKMHRYDSAVFGFDSGMLGIGIVVKCLFANFKKFENYLASSSQYLGDSAHEKICGEIEVLDQTFTIDRWNQPKEYKPKVYKFDFISHEHDCSMFQSTDYDITDCSMFQSTDYDIAEKIVKAVKDATEYIVEEPSQETSYEREINKFYSSGTGFWQKSNVNNPYISGIAGNNSNGYSYSIYDYAIGRPSIKQKTNYHPCLLKLELKKEFLFKQDQLPFDPEKFNDCYQLYLTYSKLKD